MINLVFCLKYSHAYSQVLRLSVLRTLIAVSDKLGKTREILSGVMFGGVLQVVGELP